MVFLFVFSHFVFDFEKLKSIKNITTSVTSLSFHVAKLWAFYKWYKYHPRDCENAGNQGHVIGMGKRNTNQRKPSVPPSHN